MITKVNNNKTYQSLQPLWLQLTNIEGMITKVNNNKTYQSLQPLWLQLTNIEGMITKVNYNQMYRSLQPLWPTAHYKGFWLQRSITTKCTSPYNHSGHSSLTRRVWLQRSITIIPYVPVTTTILPIAYQIWADSFKRWLNGRDHTTITPTVNLPSVDNKIGLFKFRVHIKKCSQIPVKLNLRK
jgi:hypothetical protein